MECHECGTEFTPKRRSQKFCQTKCNVTASQRRYKAANPGAATARSKAWRENNPERYKENYTRTNKKQSVPGYGKKLWAWTKSTQVDPILATIAACPKGEELALAHDILHENSLNVTSDYELDNWLADTIDG